MQDEKSQIQNRAKALQVLRSRLLKLEQDRQAAELSGARKSQVGGGGRVREDPHLQLQGEPGHRPPHRAHALQARQGAGRRARRGDRRAGRRRAGPAAQRAASEPLHLARAARRGRSIDCGGRGRRRRPGAALDRRAGHGPRRRPSWSRRSTSRPTERDVRCFDDMVERRAHGRAAAVRARALGRSARSTCSSTGGC